jgi:hypothetical protein
MIDERKKRAYEQCFRRVLYFYRPSEAPGLRPGTEKMVAITIAWEAGASGLLPPLDIEYLADRSRLSVRTFRRYLKVLFEIEWLLECTHRGKPRVRIDPTWLKGLPLPPPPGTGG